MVSPCNLTIKFLCSYGGKILPRYPDGKLRYHGGETRVLAVHGSISFSELLVKLGEMIGTSSVLTLRCQLPTEDLDALISITSDEDLANLIEEYDRAAAGILNSSHKIRAFLSNPNPTAAKSSPSLPSSSNTTPTSTPRPISPKSLISLASPVSTMMIKNSSCSNRIHPITALLPPPPPPTATGGGRCVVHQMAVNSRNPVKLIPRSFHYCNNYEKKAAAAGKIPHHYAYCTATSTSPAGKTGHMYLVHHGYHWQ